MIYVFVILFVIDLVNVHSYFTFKSASYLESISEN